MTPRVGDVVHVRGTVRDVYGGRAPQYSIYFDGPAREIEFFNGEDIIHIEPAPMKVGDRVRFDLQDGPDAGTGTIVAICKGFAMIDDGDDEPIMERLEDLELAP